MAYLIEQDSDEMGYLVDRWLHARRINGSTTRQLAYLARRLAEETRRPPSERGAIWADFETFCGEEPQLAIGGQT